MRLSVILELLLIFLLIAFAAYGRVIERTSDGRGITGKKAAVTKGSADTSLKQATDNVNKYCVCNENICNCCRDFHIPLVQLSGPGCASLQYLQDDKLAMQLSIGDNILSSNVVNGKNPKPVCVALPGGFSKFCGKIYSIKRDADKNFKACLGLELRSSSELEASLRVSCFRFGPDGLKLRPAEPIPASLTGSSTSSDDDYDFFGLDDDDDDDDDDEEEEDDDDQKVSPESNLVAGTVDSAQLEQVQDQDEQEEEDDDDILGLGALFDIFAGDDDETTKKKKVTTPTPLPPSFAIPILSLTSTAAPVISQELSVNKNPTAASTSADANSSISPDNLSILNPEEVPTQVANDNEISKITPATEKESSVATEKVISEDTTTIANIGLNEKTSVTGQANKVTGIKATNIKPADKIKLKKVVVPIKKKVSVAPPSVNAIIANTLRPQEEEQTTNSANDDDGDDDYEYNDSQSDEVEDSDEENLESDKNEEDEDNKQVSNEKDDEDEDDDEEADEDEEDDETAEAVVDDDDDDEEEEAVLSALMDDDSKNSNQEGNKNKKKNDKTNNANKTADDGDYGDLAELLARKHPTSRIFEQNKNLRTRSRQSKVMRI